MRRYMIIILIVVFSISIGYCLSGYFHKTKAETVGIFNKDTNVILSTAVTLVKKYEEFSSKIYKCPSGQKTIGYGETFFLKKYGNNLKIDDSDFDNLLYLRMQEIILDIKYKYFYKNHKHLTNNEVAALSSLIYNIGEGNFLKSTLYGKVKNYLDYKRKKDKKSLVVMKNSIIREWTKWVFYKDEQGHIKKSSSCNKKDGKCLENRRKEEAKLFFIN